MDEGLEGLKETVRAFRTGSETRTDAEVIEKILWLRQQYHFGPHTIAMYLARYHDITISPSGIWRILNTGPEPAPGVAALQAQGDPVETL